MSELTKPTEQTQEDPYATAYLDKRRFPLTTQRDLTLKDQKLIDAINKDDIRCMKEEGRPLTPELEAIWREFEEKAKLRQAEPPTD